MADIKVKDLTITTTGSTSDFIIKDKADGSATEKMEISSFITNFITSPTPSYVAKTANYTALTTDDTIECTANTFTITLPTSVGASGKIYTIKNSGTGVITVDTTSSQTIDGDTTILLVQGNSLTVQSNNANWIKLNNMTSNVGGFTTLVQSTVVMSTAGSYATGDYMGTSTTPQSFSSAVRISGGSGVIKSILISDKITTANVAMELWILDRTFTAPSDNAAFDLSDANALFVQAVIPIATAGWYNCASGQIYCDNTLSWPIKSNGTTLFYALVARGTTPSFTSSDLTITLGILQD